MIVDIDEASLAALSNEYGRWPWPRDTLGAALNYLERNGAAGVVFDILMSDPDRQNPAGDEAFALAVAQSQIAWFPVLRLNPANDAGSTLKLAQLKGFAQGTPQALRDAPVAAIPPFFQSALSAQRLGFHNVYPDADSVIRSYRYRELKDGWTMNALPTSIAKAQGWALPSRHNALINWPTPSAQHTTVPFYQVLNDSLSKTPQVSSTLFKGKWIIVGSTAPSLHDVKATPLKAIQPGVEVLAIALDNVKNNAYKYALPAWLIAALTALVLLASVWLVRRYSQSQLSFAFIFVPSALLGLSFLSLHIGRYFVDLTVPAQAAFLLLTVAKFHAYTLSWAHAQADVLHKACGTAPSVLHQTVAAIPKQPRQPKQAKQVIPDWLIFEAFRQHTGVLYLDNRAAAHPLSDNGYTWCTSIQAIPQADAANAMSLPKFDARIAAVRTQGIQPVCFNKPVNETVFSEASARDYFWATVAQQAPVLRTDSGSQLATTA